MKISFFYKAFYFIIALIGLNSIIFLHEFGHFTFCKVFGVSTPVFSIGFGPQVSSKMIGDTLFTISALPLGGYVAIKGMDSAAKNSQGNFNAIPFWQKILILLGGILFNLIFGFTILALYSPTKNISTYSGRSGLIGSIGILQTIASSASQGLGNLIVMLAILSINLGLFNLLPVPILDGGQMLMITLETLKARRLLMKQNE